ncbi:homocysteine-induced endoplasmic reticulum protein [Arctopsyche grandis]|uniref:homocysteine-induced endoplasmic reticulum protein n=1 Tax=Arctopsyche grandis TaxID=121162 RepID=UPI00406D9A67
MEESLGVTLIVKAPNQQVADQTIRCQPHWTIRRLKGHLSEVYPCKPKSEEQKLIYSGQLLSDTVVLKDVLRKYEGQDTHTVHLVCTSPQAKYGIPPKPKPAPSTSGASSQARPTRDTQSVPISSNTSSTDGLRHRSVGETSSIENRQDNANNANAPNPQNPYSYNPYTSYYWNQEQIDAWNTQMNHWAAAGYNAYPTGTTNTPNLPNMDPMMFAAQVAWMQQMRMQQMQQYYVGNFAGPQVYPPNQQVPGFNTEQVYGNIQDNQEVHQPVHQQEPVNNANNDGNDQDNRDWLDWFYNFSRILVMASIVYFYSSPMRFLIVLILGTTIYLFQTGYFTIRVNNNNHNEQRQDIADNINNNYQQPADNNNEQVQNNAALEPDASNQDNTVANNQVVNEDSFFTITWTAFTSFFTSLIPETPNAIRN